MSGLKEETLDVSGSQQRGRFGGGGGGGETLMSASVVPHPGMSNAKQQLLGKTSSERAQLNCVVLGPSYPTESPQEEPVFVTTITVFFFFSPLLSHSGELRTQKLKVPSSENTELKRSPFKIWSRSVYSHNATLTARDFFLAYLYSSGPFTCIFSETSPDFSCVGSCVDPQNKIGHPAGGRFLC